MGVRTKAGPKGDKRTSILKLLRDHPEYAPEPKRPLSALNAAANLEATRNKCREWAARLEEARRSFTALQFTSAALRALANELHVDGAVQLRLAENAAILDDEARELAETVGCGAAHLPTDEALYYVTSLYPALLPQQTRGKLGAFYTPPALTRRLVALVTEHGLDWSTARVLDPAAGAGAFMIEAARAMRAAMSNSEPAFVLRQLGARLQGIEIDPNAAFLTQCALEIALGDTIAAAAIAVPQFVRVCDSLEMPQTAEFDAVLGNPPYRRVSLTPEQRTRFGRSLYGHANLYGVFTDLALRWCKRGGLLAYLTPPSFLAGHYYAALRELLRKEAPPLSIDFVHARRGVFEDVLQETLLAVYRKGGEPVRARIHYVNVDSPSEARVTRNGTVALPSQTGAPWLAPRLPEHGQLIASAERMRSRLRDWGYSVSTGPLVWNRFKSQLSEQTHSSALPLIWAECVLPNGKFEFRARKRHHTPYFEVRSGDEWLVVKHSCILVQRTTAKEQPRRLIAAELPRNFIERHGGVVIENHLNMVRSVHHHPKVDPAVVAALLNSEIVDQLFRCMNGSVAVSAFELEAMPLPTPKSLARLTNLVSMRASREKIEAECSRLYLGVP